MLANVLASDYRNCWNEAAEPGGGQDLLGDALLAVERALKLDPKSALAHYASGLIFSANGKPDEAIAAFGKAIEYDPRFARAYAQRGSELINKGQLKEALEEIDKAIRLSPDDPSAGMFYWNQGRALFFSEPPLYEEAIAALTKALRLRPNLWHNWLYLVSAFALRGDDDKARSMLEEFRNSNAVHNAANYTIAVVESHEKANPCRNESVVQGRARFHKGLERAGMRKE